MKRNWDVLLKIGEFSKCVSILVSLFSGFLIFGSQSASAQAATLQSLSLGSVISIQTCDQGMCSDSNCSSTTPPYTLPYKFVKMQARDSAGNPVSNSGYTYWALLDNYCWWGSARCKYAGAISAYQNGWNGVGGTVGTNYSNNITNTMAGNILVQLDNFYTSLPDKIDGKDKANVIPVYAWDFMPMTDAGAAGWGSTNGTWTPANTNNVPAGGVNKNFPATGTFSGANTNPTVNSRIGLLSYTDWQGGTTANSTYPTNSGSGLDYCKARFNANTGFPNNTNCTNNGSYGLFGQAASGTDPRPRFPWLRSPNSANTGNVYFIYANSATNSLNGTNANDSYGVSPSLWLIDDIKTTGAGAGTYINPYIIKVPNTAPSMTNVKVENPSGVIWRVSASTANGNKTLTVSGEVTDPDCAPTLTIQYQIDSTTGTWTNLPVNLPVGTIDTPASNTPYSGRITLPTNLTNGSHNIHIRAYDGVAYSSIFTINFRIDNNLPTISGTDASPAWYNTDRFSAIDFYDTGGSGLVETWYAFGTTNPLDATCTGGGTLIYGWSITPLAPHGGTTLWICARDGAGNIGTWSGQFNVDIIIPEVEGSNASDTWYKTERTSTLKATDEGGSGVAQIRYAFDAGGSPMNETCTDGGDIIANRGTTKRAPHGGTTLWICVRDGAGNVGTNSGPFNVDMKAPEISFTNDFSTWFDVDMATVITATDEGGSELVEIRYYFFGGVGSPFNAACTDGGNIIANGGTTPPAPLGGTTLTICARDGAGNVTTKSGLFNVDKTPPTVSASGASNLMQTTKPPIIVSAGDTGGSGLNQVRYSWDIPMEGACSGGIPTSNEANLADTLAMGNHVLYLCASDNAGNSTFGNGVYRYIPNVSPSMCI